MARTPKVVEDRREQIIDAAMRVFAQKGYSKATNKDIAREAGITPGLIYYYFESKEAVLDAILETRSPVHMLASIPSQMMAQPPAIFLRFLILETLGLVEGENIIGLIRVLLPEIIHNPEMSYIPASMFQRIFAFLGNFFEAKIASGELRQFDVSISAQVFVGSLMGFVLRRQIIHDPLALAYTHEQIAEAIVDLVLTGMLPR